MSRPRVFYSFHYDKDAWRTNQVRCMGLVEGSQVVSSNDWETLKRRGERAIIDWIDDQLYGRSCTVVLVGSETASRPWVRYEIRRSWELGKKLLGIRVHRLLDQNQRATHPGSNPFTTIATPLGTLADVVPLHDPPGVWSTDVYGTIASNLTHWIASAPSRQ